jgi:hypothetical protein
VDFGKDFCDFKFSSDKVLLMQCYASKSVSRGVEFCNANFDLKKEMQYWLLCYESIPVYDFEYC